MARQSTCENCKHWGGYREKVFKEKPWKLKVNKWECTRQCRRYPPVWSDKKNRYCWPEINYLGHCGEHSK